MSVLVPTTDEVYEAIVAELRDRIPSANIKELPQIRDLLGCLADVYLGEWMPVASILDENNGVQSVSAELFAHDWSLDRCTQFDGHVQVRGKFRFTVDRSHDNQRRQAVAQARTMADQLVAVGDVHVIMLVREHDIDVPFGTKVRLMLLAQVESRFNEEIQIDDDGVAWLEDTQIKVREVVLDYLCYGWSALRIFHEHCASISLRKIHAAFSYFDNNRGVVLKEIESANQFAHGMREKMGQPPAIQKLLARRK